MSFKPKKFGKFMLLDKIASGGMAEIFLAQTVGPGGFEKLVVIKRILPQFSTNEDFISMFVDEARTTSQLTHSNIAQIFDFGKIDESYYLAMEYVDGKNLRQILARCEELKRPIPIEYATHIVNKICEGVDYAHRFRDKRAQESLQIIHRDISPQNVLVSFEGEIKLIDFGIAKTRAKSGKSRSGILKGKFGYMSPEQANGETVDQRTDIFSTGIILFEILTRQRLFQSSNDLSILKKVQECKIQAPSLFNPDIPFELEEIVLKALDKDRNKRYQTAQDFHRDLSRFLNTLNPDFTSSHTATFVKSLFALDILDHKKIMNNILISLSPIKKPTPLDEPVSTVEEIKTKSQIFKRKDIEIPSQKTRTDIHVGADASIAEGDQVSIKKMWFQLSLMGLAIITLSVMLLILNKNPGRVIQSSPLQQGEAPIKTTPKPSSSILRIETEPAGADVILDNKRVGQTPLTLPHLAQQNEQILLLKKKGFESAKQRLFLTTPQHHIKKVLIPVGVGYLNVKTVPESNIVIDGKPVGRSPIIRFPASAGKHKIRAINKELNLSAEKEIEIKKGEERLLDERDLIFQPLPSDQ